MGSTSTFRKRVRSGIGSSCTGATAIVERHALAAELDLAPVDLRAAASARSAATRSITCSRSASSAVTATDSRTAFAAHSTLRSRSLAIDSMKAASRFSAFCDGDVAALPLLAPAASRRRCPTGCAAPMLEPGAIAAMCAAIVMKVPAEPAHAPWGAT